MKQRTRKLLSLLLTLVMVCGMLPTALAAEEIQWTGGDGKCSNGQHTQGNGTVTKAATCKDTGIKTYTCSTCQATGTQVIAKDPNAHVYDENSWTHKSPVAGGQDTHHHTCKLCGAEVGTTNCNSEGHIVVSSDKAGYHLTRSSCTVCKGVNTNGTSQEVACTADSAWSSDANGHFHKCSVEGCGKEIPSTRVTHTPSNKPTDKDDHSAHEYKCTVCGYVIRTEAHTWKWTKQDETGHTGTCSICNATLNAAHTFDEKGICTVCTYKNQAPVASVTVSPSSLELSYGDSRQITPVVMGTNGKPTYITTTPTFRSSNTAVAQVSATGVVTAVGLGTAEIIVEVSPTISASVSVTVKNTANVSVTVGQNLGTYTFDSNATTDGRSIYDQIVNNLAYGTGTPGYPNYPSYPNYPNYPGYPGIGGNFYDSYEITVTQNPGTNNVATLNSWIGSSSNSVTTTVGRLSGVSLNLIGTGTWTGSYSVKGYTGIGTGATEVLSGTITVKVEPYTGTGIIYTATLGQQIQLDVNDFHNFWSEVTSGRGTLSSVKINSVAAGNVGGGLYYTGGSRNIPAQGQTFYTNPQFNQNPLANLTFIPGSNNRYKTGSVTISFTATGTGRYATGSAATTSANGVITILYTDGEVQAINYPLTTGSAVLLNASDFDAVYLKATASTNRNPSYTVKFLELPRYGTLYANYGTNNRGQITGTELTQANLNSMSFTNRSNSVNALGKVAYVAGRNSAPDAVRYAVYSGSSLLYVGTVNFGVENLTVTYSCGASGVSFRAADFFSASNSLAGSQYVTFGAPSFGTLYKNYANGSGTRVTVSDRFSFSSVGVSGGQSINTVTYVPSAGFNGVVEIPFTSVSTNGITTSGVVKIYVVTKNFTDVAPSSWAHPYITRLVAEGVVSGTTPTTFSPKANLKYGEALKMILIAAGYPAQSEGTGANWAANYLTLAYNNGIVSNRNVDLNAAIDRTTIAEIAAKALKIPAANSVNLGIIGPTDTTNGYVYALYNAGIVGGDSSSGRNLYRGSSPIIREEICKIICNVSDYHAAHK